MEVDHEKTGGASHDEVFSGQQTDAVAHLASHEDHQQTRMQAIKQNPWAFAWCMYAVWMTIVVSFENQASGIVIGIPQFRKDFGYLDAEGGTYVIPAQWQAAFSAGPVAS